MRTSDPQPGDIGLTRISGWVGAGIRLGQWLNGDGFADYEHAFMVVPGGRVVEAMPGGARVAPLEEYAGRDVKYLRCPDDHRAAVVAAAYRYVGVPYSFADYAGLALHRLHIPAPGLRAYIRSTGHMTCSQLVDRAAMDGGWHLFADGRWEADVTPGDLYGLWARKTLARQITERRDRWPSDQTET